MQAISTDDYTSGQANTLGRTRNTATIIPQSYLDERMSQMGGRSQFAAPGSGSMPLKTQSGGSLSAMAGNFQSAVQPYQPAPQTTKSASDMTYNDWAQYFAKLGPSSEWSNDNWELFHYLSVPSEKYITEAGLHGSLARPGPSLDNNTFFRFTEATKMPGYMIGPQGDIGKTGEYGYAVAVTPAMLYGYKNEPYEKAVAETLQMLYGTGAGFVPDTSLRDKAYGPQTYAHGGTAPSWLAQMFGSDMAGQMVKNQWQPQSVSAGEVAAEYNRLNSPYGLQVDGANESYEDVVPWIASYFPADEAMYPHNNNAPILSQLNDSLQRKVFL